MIIYKSGGIFKLHQIVYSELPLETWTDVFGFVPRSQLVLLTTTISDRQFVSYVQFFLHKCGQITLDKLTMATNYDGNPTIFNKAMYWYMPLADVPPISENITNFKELSLRFTFSN
jgi:hypothetical protein